MEKVLKMAEGIDIGETRSYELVPSRKLKRYRSPSDSESICSVSDPSLSLSLSGGQPWEQGDTSVPWGCLWDSWHSKMGGSPMVGSAGLQSSSPSSAMCMIHTQLCLCLGKYHFSFQLSGNWFPLGLMSGIKYLSGFVCCGEV